MKKIYLLCLLLFSNFLSFSQDLYLTTTQLNIRSGAGTKFSIVGTLKHGQTVEIDQENDGWGRVIINQEVKGYVSMRFLQKESNTNKKTKSNSTIFFICLISIVLIYRFFFGKNKWNPNSNKSYTKIQPMKWFFCKNCSVKIQSKERPKKYGCSKSHIHHWYELGKVGNKNYICKFCGTTIPVENKPDLYRCSHNNVHQWYEL